MDFLIYMFETRLYLFIGMLGLLFFVVSFFVYIVFYVYMNINLKSISKIIFNNENKYKRPLEPFNFIFLSFLPITYWREIINIKYHKNFRKLYGKESFYYSINKDQLIELLKKYKIYFVLQYIVFFFTGLALIFVIFSYVLYKYS